MEKPTETKKRMNGLGDSIKNIGDRILSRDSYMEVSKALSSAGLSIEDIENGKNNKTKNMKQQAYYTEKDQAVFTSTYQHKEDFYIGVLTGKTIERIKKVLGDIPLSLADMKRLLKADIKFKYTRIEANFYKMFLVNKKLGVRVELDAPKCESTGFKFLETEEYKREKKKEKILHDKSIFTRERCKDGFYSNISTNIPQFIRPLVAGNEINIALDFVGREDAMKRIPSYINGIIDGAEMQFNTAIAVVRAETRMNAGECNPTIKQREYKLEDKMLVWAWNEKLPIGRGLVFYDDKNNSHFNGSGKRQESSARYDSYKPFIGDYPEWAKKAYNKLED